MLKTGLHVSGIFHVRADSVFPKRAVGQKVCVLQPVRIISVRTSRSVLIYQAAGFVFLPVMAIQTAERVTYVIPNSVLVCLTVVRV